MKVYESQDVANEVMIWASLVLIRAKETAEKCIDLRPLRAVEKAATAIEGIQLRLASSDDANLVDLGVQWQTFAAGAASASGISNAILADMQKGNPDVDSGRIMEICKGIKSIMLLARFCAFDDFGSGETPEVAMESLKAKVEKHIQLAQWPTPKPGLLNAVHENTKPHVQVRNAEKGVDAAMAKRDHKRRKRKTPGAEAQYDKETIQRAVSEIKKRVKESGGELSMKKAAEDVRKAHGLLKIDSEYLRRECYERKSAKPSQKGKTAHR